MRDVDIRELELPDDAGDPTLLAFHELARKHEATRYGEGLMDRTPEEQLALWRPTVSERCIKLGAWRGDRLLGAATMWVPLQESLDTVDFGTSADPDLPLDEQRALHELLVERAMAEADALGRSTVMGGGPASATGRVTATTGFGGADPDDPETAPLVRRGFSLEQVYRFSIADLDRLDDLDERLAAARERSAGYEVVTWAGATPGEHRAAMRMLRERMSTDAPVGGLALEPEHWSDERLASFEEQKAAGGRTLRNVAARAADGSLVGYSTVIVGSSDVARQHDTLVLREHRGHGLGMLLKLANLVELRDHHPRHRRVSTMNAEENVPMLRVNEAVGFEAVGYEAVWQRKESA